METDKKEFILNNLLNNKKPIARFFKRDNYFYLYDTGTNKILECYEKEYDIVNNILFGTKMNKEYSPDEINSVVDLLIELINKEKIFLDFGERTEFYSNEHLHYFEDNVKNKLSQMTFEVTDSCNMRCGYCVYNDFVNYTRNHGGNIMTIDVAQKGIDLLEGSSSKLDQVSIGFYGGEPLLNFKLIKDTVDYAKSKLSKKISFTITTNGLLLNDEIIDFLFENRFSILISLDGPFEIHDFYRKDKSGKGTFSTVIKNLKKVVQKYVNNEDKLLLSMVYAPPFSGKKIDYIKSLWDRYPWLERVLPSITYPENSTIPIDRRDESSEDLPLADWAFDNYKKAFSNGNKPDQLSKAILDSSLYRLVIRKIYNEPNEFIYPNGCCVPGARKVMVGFNGEIALCEKAHGLPKIGNVFNGIDYKMVEKIFITDYLNNSKEDCSKCWAKKLCNLCYLYAFNDNEFSIIKKRRQCENVRNSKMFLIHYFVRLLDINKEAFNYMKVITYS